MKFAWALPALLALPALSALACASSSTKTQQDPGLAGSGDTTIAAPDTNPDGVPYPTDNIGTTPRSGSRPGNKIQNFKFLGYPDANVAGGLKPISLAQFFDPTGNKYRLIHIQAAGSWCVYCQKETELLVPLAQKLADRKVVWLVSLAEGPSQGDPSTQKDLDAWIAEFKSPFTHVLDPANRNLGPFYDRAALPWNADVNAMTMEILQAGTGAPTSAEEILADVDSQLTLVGGPK